MSNELLAESTTVPVKTGTGRWKAVLITPGEGSSGFYSESVLQEYGPTAFRKGAKSFVTHNRLENGEPDPFRMWGFLTEDARYEEGVGLVGEIEVLPSWRDRVEEVAPHTALSVYVMGERDEEGNITSLMEDTQNGVDLVVFPGRPGSSLVEQMYESATPGSDERPSVTSAQETNRKESIVDEKLDKLIEMIGLLVAKDEAKVAEAAQATADEAAKIEAVEAVLAAVKAIDEADLLPSQVEALRAEAKKGADVAPLIEAAKQVKADALASLQESADEAPAGRIVESASRKYESATDLGKVFG